MEFCDLSFEWEMCKDEYNEEFSRSGISGLVNKAEQDLRKWEKIPLLFGITGRSGTGKSSFINAIRNLNAEDKGAAEVGVTETTENVQIYTHPDNHMLKLADLPGVGTPKFPKTTYLTDERIQFDTYDVFIIVSCDRFTEDDLWLAEQIIKRKKSLVFVRTKVAQDMKNEKSDRKGNYKRDPEKFLRDVVEKIRQEIKEQLCKSLSNKNGEIPAVFLIDSKKPGHQLLDFSSLCQILIEKLPKFKRDALVLTLTHLGPSLVNEKERVLKGQTWKRALASVTGSLIPIPGASLYVDVGILLSAAKDFEKQFGLEQEALAKVAESVHVSVDHLVASTGIRSVSLQLTASSVLRFCAEQVSVESMENATKFIPFLGFFASSMISYAGTTYSLRKLVSLFADDARKVQAYASKEIVFC